MPSAYVRGSVDTFKAEAADITSKGAAHGIVAHKDAVKEQLAMMDDIATINDIHAAYIHGSVPTAKGESDDIMNMNFPDEVGICAWTCVAVCCSVLQCVECGEGWYGVSKVGRHVDIILPDEAGFASRGREREIHVCIDTKWAFVSRM